MSMSTADAALTTPRRTSGRSRPWVVASLAVIALMIQGTGTFHYDAQQYWLGALGLITGHGTPDGFFELRGALTATLYTPAALLSRIFGEASIAFFVLLQNSLVIAWLGTWILPSMLRRSGCKNPHIESASTFLVVLATYSFAPYPLVDIYAALLCILGASLLVRGKALHLIVAGLCLGIAVNTRPAYIVTAGFLIIFTLPWSKWRIALVALGAAAAQLPQIVLNMVMFDTFRSTPTATDSLIGLQASFASYIVRYDTLLGAPIPQQFYCSPSMAGRVAGHEPTTTMGLASTLVRDLPDSFLFALQKISAALHWPLRTPYSIPDPGLDAAFALFITTLTVLGICGVVRSAYRMRANWRDPREHANTLLLAIASGSTLTLVSSATESRFALPLVLVGIAGCANLLTSRPVPRAMLRPLVLVAGGLSAAVVALGYWGLSHPAVPGSVTATICSVG